MKVLCPFFPGAAIRPTVKVQKSSRSLGLAKQDRADPAPPGRGLNSNSSTPTAGVLDRSPGSSLLVSRTLVSLTVRVASGTMSFFEVSRGGLVLPRMVVVWVIQPGYFDPSAATKPWCGGDPFRRPPNKARAK